MLVKIKFIILIVAIFIISCKEGKNNIIKLKSNDTLGYLKLVPIDQDAENNKHQKGYFTQQMGQYLGMVNITKGYIGQNIRIWLPNEKAQYVVDITNNKLNHRCTIIEWRGKEIAHRKYIMILKEADVIPISGWETFFDTLKNFQLSARKGGKSVEDLPDFSTHMYMVQFEIASPNKYNLIEYLEPSYYRYVDNESCDIYNLLKYLNKEFGMDIYCPPKDFITK